MIGLIPWSKSQHKKRGRPYVYSPTVILRCFIVRIWLRLDSNRALHEFLELDYPYNRKVLRVCGLTKLPDRRTFDRRLKTISLDIKERISSMGNLFVNERLVDPYIVAIDSTLLRAKGHLWHKSSMIKGVVPCSGIDIDARWGFSHTKGWMFGYKLHITSSTGSLIIPLSADFTRADVQDNQIYPKITSSLPQGVHYMAADSGYDDHKLYNLSTDRRGFELVCPVSEIYNNTSSDRLQLIEFYESELGQVIYSWRGISVEPLIEHIKDVFKIDPLPVRGYQKAAAIVLLSVLLYQIIVYYNCKTHKEHPKAIKHMLGS
jgi:Transposase DDE domain